MVMKWVIYLIRRKDLKPEKHIYKDVKPGVDVYIGRLAYRDSGDSGDLERALKRRLETKKQYIERNWDRGIRIRTDLELYKRMLEVRLENREIVPLTGASAPENENPRVEAEALFEMTCNAFKPDLNELWLPQWRRNLRRIRDRA